MRKRYSQPTVQIVLLASQDIVCTSPSLYDGPLGARGEGDFGLWDGDE